MFNSFFRFLSLLLIQIFLLTNLSFSLGVGNLTQGSAHFLGAKADKGKEFNDLIVDIYNLMLRMLLGSSEKQQAIIIDEDIVNFDDPNLLLLILPLMKDMITQIMNRDFDFIIKIKHAENASILRQKYITMLNLYDIRGKFNIIFAVEEDVARYCASKKDLDVIDIEEPGHFTLYDIILRLKDSIEASEVHEDALGTLEKEAIALIVRTHKVAKPKPEGGTLMPKKIPTVEVARTSAQVFKDISFGTAGYRGNNSLAFLASKATPLRLEALLKDKKLTALEKENLEKYMQVIKTDEAKEEINVHVAALLGISMARVALKYNGEHAERKVDEIILCKDPRGAGQEYVDTLARAILGEAGTKLKVTVLAGYTTTPELSWLILHEGNHKNAWGLNVTSSHNPFWFTGFKPEYFGRLAPNSFTDAMAEEYQHVYQDTIEFNGAYELAAEDAAADFVTIIKRDQVVEKYSAQLLNRLVEIGIIAEPAYKAFSDLVEAYDGKLALDVKWGAGIDFWNNFKAKLSPEAQEKFLIFNNTPGGSDGIFDTNKPEPALANLGNLKDVMEEKDCGLGTDPDGDRTTVVEKVGKGLEEISMNELAGLFVFEKLNALLKDPKDIKEIVLATTLVSSKFAGLIVEYFKPQFEAKGIKVKIYENLPVGFKNFGETPETDKEASQNLLAEKPGRFSLCFEESGGMSLGGWVQEKDGALGCLLAAGMRMKHEKSLLQQVEDIKKVIGRALVYEKDKTGMDHPKIKEKGYNKCAPDFKAYFNKAKTDPAKNAEFIAGLQAFIGQEYKISALETVDGLKINLSAKDGLGGFIAFRLSGTEPIARVYANLWGPIANSEEVKERTVLLRQGGMRFFAGFIVEQALGKIAVVQDTPAGADKSVPKEIDVDEAKKFIQEVLKEAKEIEQVYGERKPEDVRFEAIIRVLKRNHNWHDYLTSMAQAFGLWQFIDEADDTSVYQGIEGVLEVLNLLVKHAQTLDKFKFDEQSSLSYWQRLEAVKAGDVEVAEMLDEISPKLIGLVNMSA